MQEEGTLSFIKPSIFPTENEGAELEGSMNILEENLLILKVKQSGQAPAGGHGLEKFGGGLVGVDTRRREQADQAVGLEQIHGALHE